jgi:pyrrolysyl-tRNA synthetase-like protein
MKKAKKKYYRKRLDLFRLITKIKLWPSRKGLLHGIKTIEHVGDQAWITTHCMEVFLVNRSKNSRAARCLRNKWFADVCGKCSVPQWKLDKFAATTFNRNYGSTLHGVKTI